MHYLYKDTGFTIIWNFYILPNFVTKWAVEKKIIKNCDSRFKEKSCLKHCQK